MSRGEILFTEGPLNKKIIKFVLPLIMAYFIQQAYSSADLIIVGHTMGKNGSAAIGASSLIITIAIGLFSGLAMGVSMLFARAYGAGDNERKKENISRIIQGCHCTWYRHNCCGHYFLSISA